jgi:hypothetical protein
MPMKIGEPQNESSRGTSNNFVGLASNLPQVSEKVQGALIEETKNVKLPNYFWNEESSPQQRQKL